MQKELWQLTPKQYYIYRINKTYEKYNREVTKKEIIELTPISLVNKEHFDIIIQSAKEGNRIPNNVMDKLTEIQRYRLVHDYYEQHKYYLSPEARKFNKENKFSKTPGRKRKVI